APKRDEPRLFHAHVPADPHAAPEVPAAPGHRGHDARGHGQRHPRQLPQRLHLAGARDVGAARRDTHANDRGGDAPARALSKEGEGARDARPRPARRRDRGARRRAHDDRAPPARGRRREGRKEGEVAMPVLAMLALLVSPIPAESRQMVLSVSANWTTPSARVRFYERTAGGPWKPAGEAVTASLGKSGLAWGRGLHPEDVVGTKKKEGDGKSPAGIFELRLATGYAKTAPPG